MNELLLGRGYRMLGVLESRRGGVPGRTAGGRGR